MNLTLRIIVSLTFLFPSIVSAQQYFGGNASGIASSITTNLQIGIPQASPMPVYSGGAGDGFTNSTTSNNTLGGFESDSVYNGSNGNGFITARSNANTIGFTELDSLYNGGDGKGESIISDRLDLSTCVVYVWTGNVSNTWPDPNNWECGVAPASSSNVLIPSGLVRYPIIFIDVEIKKLTVQPGATLTLTAGRKMIINGDQ